MKIFLKGGTEKTLIMAVREALTQRFQATDWVDLRVGFFLSVTQAGADDTITGLAETIGIEPRPRMQIMDYFYIGIAVPGICFMGYTNRPTGPVLIGSSKLVSSDQNVGTTNTNFWRPRNELRNHFTLMILDQNIVRATSSDGSQLHLPQNTGGAGGYATLIGMRFQRDDARGRANIIRMSVKTSYPNYNGDILYNSDPSKSILENNLEGFPTTVQQLGPVEMSQVPDSLFVYWPWFNSRLRIHSAGIVKAA